LQNQVFGLILADGVHLSAQGQRLVAKILQKTLANLLKIA
jgi:lysophospholipase L1-like esterase